MNREIGFKVGFIVIYVAYLLIRLFFGKVIQKTNGRILYLDKDAVENEGRLRLFLRIMQFITRNIAIVMYVLGIGDIFKMNIPNVIRIFGIVLGILSLGLLIHVQMCLGRFWSTSLKIVENHELIQDGIYKYIRHPMYLVLINMMIAYTLITSYWLVAIPSLVAVVNIYTRIDREEDMLIKQFGDNYIEYRKTTNKILPKILWF